MKVLIIQTAFIGDVVLALPIAQALCAHFPDAKIHFLVRNGNQGLLENHPNVHQTWVWDKKNKFASAFQLIQNFRKQKFDYAINVQRFASSGILTVLSGAKVTIGFAKNPLSKLFHYSFPHEFKENLHEVHRNLSLLKPLITDIPLVRPKLFPTERHFQKVEIYQQKPYLVMAPASVWFTKQWSEEQWKELVNLAKESYKVYLVGAPSDFELCDRVASGSKNVENLCGKLNFLETCALMKNAKRVFVNDSAPLHFASAMNAPVTAFFCSTVPEFGFTPLSDDSEVLSVKLDCKPCGLHGRKNCPQGHFLCSKKISPQTAFETIIDLKNTHQ